jgi:nitrogen fixation NifU-like protein
MKYSTKVMEHFANPHNVGDLPDANGIGSVGNAVCGDIMKMYIKVEDDIIVDVRFQTFGCGAAIATSSISTDMIKGKPIREALQLTNQAVAEALGGLPPVKMHCSVLAEEAVRSAIDDYYRRTTGKGLDEQPHTTDCDCIVSTDESPASV